ncbi:unnamed protein product [Durusdinium trenchii]|uniref:Uncharacterized protein n=1 Tax=Durusdinium trenchii TaxID=1381693 RepID=A0ABP0KR82_9DINO
MSFAAVLALVAFFSALVQWGSRRARRARRTKEAKQVELFGALAFGIEEERLVSNREEFLVNSPGENEKNEQILAFRVILGVGICFGSFQAPWQALPVLIDRKIAQDADPFLPLSSAQITFTQTAMFVGWLLGAVMLHPLMQRLQMKEVVVFLAAIMLGLSVATITLPYITALSMTLLCLVRLLHGMCLNIQGVQYMYMQHCFPGRGSELCSLVNALYAVVAVLMAVLCGTVTLTTDWRIEALTWFGLPMLLGLFVGFPDLGSVLRGASQISLHIARGVPVSKIEEEAEEGMSPAMRQDLANLGICFMATVFAYYGLSYSADSLSSNPFISATLISGSDVLACLFASCASRWGLLRAQLGGFLAAALSLLACALGTVDSPFTISVAIVARMALSVVFVTIYVALAQIFPERYQKTALPTCEIMARAGGCLSPSCGTLPAHISLPIFGFACLVATRATMKLPDKPSIKER